MRGRAEEVLVSLDSKDGDGPFVCFSRRDYKASRTFYHLTERQIKRVADMMNRMSLYRELRVHAHTWGWAAIREVPLPETRAEEAQRLVDEGRVEQWAARKYQTGWYISATCGKYLIAVYPNGHYVCDCAWGAQHSYTGDLCAHALAVKLMMLEESP